MEHNHLIHILVSGAASAVSELTSIAVISVTGVCLRQKDNEQRRMHACTTEDAVTESLLRANAKNNMVMAPLGLIIFPAYCSSLPWRISSALCSDMNWMSVQRG